jgi:DNA polymerase III subunit delta'
MKYPWLQSYFELMSRAWYQHRLPHALLLRGTQGVGKGAFADLLAQWVLCENKQEAMSCGQCRSCHLFQTDSHPDALSVQLELKSKVIKVDQIRRLSQQLSQTPFGHYQVVIIEDAEKMNIAASNALLKTLEEPCGSVLIILIVQPGMSLPATIHSRCQHLNITVDTPESAFAWLRKTYPEEDAERLWRHSLGAPLLSAALLENDYFKCREQVLRCLEQAMQQRVNPLPVVAQWLKYEMSDVVRILLLVTMDCIKLAGMFRGDALVNEGEKKRLMAIVSTTNAIILFRFYDHLIKVQETLSTGIAVNKQILFENIMLAWLGVCRGV